VAGRLRHALENPGSPAAYGSAKELRGELRSVRRSLIRHGGERAANGRFRDFERQAEVFGFHLARLDVRQESTRVAGAVAEVLAREGSVEDYLALGEAGRLAALRGFLGGPAPLEELTVGLSEDSREILETLGNVGRAR